MQLRGGIYMKYTSIIYNNHVLDLDTFINKILYSNIEKERIPISDIKESSDHYIITIDPFYQKHNIFEVYYKNSFLILQIKYEDSSINTRATKLFYLPNININKISHTYHNDCLLIKIPKIYFNNL